MKNIVETAISAGTFNTLVTAVKAADLVKTLSSPGPFTVFAPTDDAFAKLPAGTIDELLKDKAKLTSILTYHVVPKKVMVKDFGKLTSKLTTVQGQDLKLSAAMWHIKKSVKVNDSKTIKTDIECSNGVIHVIDSVLIPK